MTTTLEMIEVGMYCGGSTERDKVLASETRSLRDRLDALERVQRDGLCHSSSPAGGAEESRHNADGDDGEHFRKTPDNDCCVYEGNQCLHVDELIERAETAERERDVQKRWRHETQDQRDAARAALAKIADSYHRDTDAHKIAAAALASTTPAGERC